MIAPISVIIPTMNRPDSLERTLKHLAEGTIRPNQIVIVDQSQDCELCRRNRSVLDSFSSAFEELKYVFQSKPSLTKARNNGALYANNDVIIMADDDIDVAKDTIANVASIMKDQQIALVAGIDRLTRQSSSNLGYLLGTKSFFKRRIGHVTRSMLGRYPDNIKKQVETQWAQGYFFVVRKSLLKKWNCHWDENLTSYAYAEDLDYSYAYYKHAKAEGLKCVLDPNVMVDHLATLEYRIPSKKSLYMYIINRVYLSHKHHMGLRGQFANTWCNFWRLIEHAIRRDHPCTFAKAWLSSVIYRKDIIAGNLDYDKFMK